MSYKENTGGVEPLFKFATADKLIVDLDKFSREISAVKKQASDNGFKIPEIQIPADVL